MMKIKSYENCLRFLHNGLVKMKILLIENLGNEFFADENKANYGNRYYLHTM